MTKVITQIYLIKDQSALKFQSSDCNHLQQLTLVPDPLQEKQLDNT